MTNEEAETIAHGLTKAQARACIAFSKFSNAVTAEQAKCTSAAAMSLHRHKAELLKVAVWTHPRLFWLNSRGMKVADALDGIAKQDGR